MPNVTVDRTGPVTTVGLYGTDGRLPLSAPGIVELMDTLDAIETDGQVRCVVFTGAGSNFATGADLAQILASDAEANERYNRTLIQLTNRVDRLSLPTLASINGRAFGGGLELALACDLRIAAADAVVGLPETRLGLIPGAGGTQRLPRLIGEARAKELLLTGRTITANEAEFYGLVTEVVPPDQLESRTHRLATTLSQNAPLAASLAKREVAHGRDINLYEAIDHTHTALQELVTSHDLAEGLQAFQQKRPPVYLGR